MDKIKPYLIGSGAIFGTLCALAIVVIFIIMPIVFPCVFKPFDWYSQCKPEKILCPQFTYEKDGKCIDECPFGQKKDVYGKCTDICPYGQKMFGTGHCISICPSDQVYSNGYCVDVVYPPSTTPNTPNNPNPSLPTSTTSPVQDPAYSPPVPKPVPSPVVTPKQDYSISSLLQPDVATRVIHNYNYSTQVKGWSYMESIIGKLDHIVELTIVPKKNPAYQGICKATISHSSMGAEVQLNAIGRTPPETPSGDDLRPMSYYVWGVGKHMFTVIDKNSLMQYRIDLVLSFD
jgi:hypothetical protein